MIASSPAYHDLASAAFAEPSVHDPIARSPASSVNLKPSVAAGRGLPRRGRGGARQVAENRQAGPLLPRPILGRPALRSEADTLNRTVRSLFTPPERRFFKPEPLRAPSNPLNYRAFNIRTKMAVVRLRRRKWAERDEKRPKMGLRAGPHGSDNLPGRPHSAGFRPLIRSGKRMSRLGRLGGGRGTVVEPSPCAGRPAGGSRCKFGTLKT